jgi:hypothetical protein
MPAPGLMYGWVDRFDEAVLDIYLTRVWRPVLGWGPRWRLPSPLLGPASPMVAADRVAAAVALLPAGWKAAARETRRARGSACFEPLPAAAVRPCGRQRRRP